MKNLFISFLLLLLSVTLSAQKQSTVISCHVNDVPFSEFCSLIAKQTSVKVFYQEKWINQLKVTLNADSITPLLAITQVLKGTGLEVSVWHGNLMVLPGEKLIPSLPSYITNTNTTANTEGGPDGLTESEEKYITGRQPNATQTILIGRKGASITGTKAKLSGRIMDEETGEPILYATIFIEETKTGAVSDANGFVSISLKPGMYNVQAEYQGYAKKKYQFDVLSDGNFTITMKKSFIQMQEVVVYGDRQMSMKLKDPGLEKLSVKAIRSIPMMLGERDILKVSQMLPGIVSVGEGSAGINVRGGSSDQNAFYLNKIPIYNTSHLFGFFPAFNSDIIKDFSVYKGLIPAKYGGRLSSVFNIVSRQGNRKRFMARGGISPISANIVLEGPIKKDVSSILISARSSYSDWMLQKIKDPVIRASNAAFSDFSASVNYDLSKTQISAFAYYSKDRFKLSDINEYEYSNGGVSLNFSHNYSSSLHAEYAIIGSKYSFTTIDKQEVSSAYAHTYNIGQLEARADFDHATGDKNTLEYGADIIYYALDRGTINPYGAASLRLPVKLGEEQAYESSLYISDNYDLLPWLNVSAGIRYSMFTPTGPKTVYTYRPDAEMIAENVTDSIVFGNNKPIKWYGSPQIRAAVNMETDPNGSIKISFSQMSQNLFMLNNTISISPNTQWKLADYHIAPSNSNQLSLGVFRTTRKGFLESSLEVFYKYTTDYPEFKDGADFLNNPNLETAILQGTQKAYGIEFFLKRSSKKLEGWLSYTYSRSIVQVDGGEDWNSINGGISYPANHDIPHSLNLVLSYHITRRLIFSSIVTYQTGKPVTYPVSVYYIEGLPYLDYSARNAYRIPDYFRTDASLTIEGNLKKRKLLHSSIILSAYNVTGRQNPYTVFFKTDNGNIYSYQYSVIGVPIFTITWLFKLGNYATD